MALVRFYWGAPAKGEFPSYAPDQLPDGGARALTNYLVHLPQKISPRGNIGGPTANIDTGSAVDTTNGGTLLGTSVIDDTIVATYRAPSGSPLVDNWRVPINRPQNAADLAQPSLGATAGQSVDLATGTVTAIATAAATSVFGPRSARVNQAIYSVSFGGVSTAVSTGVAPLNAIRKVVVGGAGVVLTNGPRFVQDVIDHYGRLWAIGARQPGGADYDPSQAFFTIPGGTTGLTDVLTDWKDPVSGLVNTILIGTSNDGDFNVAIGRAAGYLVFFKRRSVWILYGTSTTDFTLRQLRTGLGCVDPRSVCICDEGVYFASQRGFELFDGTNFKLLSQPVAAQWLEFSNRGPAASTVNHAFIRTTLLPNNYLHIALGVDGTAANSADGTELNWLYYVPTGAWIRMSTQMTTTLGLNATGAVNRAVVTPNYVTVWGASKFARADRLTYGPDAAVGVRDRDSATSYSVSLTWSTGLADIGRVWETAMGSRVTADYAQTWLDTTPANLATWGTITLEDSTAAIDTSSKPLILPGYQPLLAPLLRRRPMLDAKYELPHGDVEMTLSANNGASAASRMGGLAVYGMGVEYEVARQRRL